MLSLIMLFTSIGGGAGFSVDASNTYTYENEDLGFSLTLPAEFEQDLGIEEYKNGVSFIYKPSVSDDWGIIIRHSGDYAQKQLFDRTIRPGDISDHSHGGYVI